MTGRDIDQAGLVGPLDQLLFSIPGYDILIFHKLPVNRRSIQLQSFALLGLTMVLLLEMLQWLGFKHLLGIFPINLYEQVEVSEDRRFEFFLEGVKLLVIGKIARGKSFYSLKGVLLVVAIVDEHILEIELIS